MTPAPATAVRPLQPARSAEPDKEHEGGAGERHAMSKDDAEQMAKEMAELRRSIDGLVPKVAEALKHADMVWVDHYGVGGSEGASHKVARLLESNASTRREMRITRSKVRDLRKDVKQEFESFRADLRRLSERTLLERVIVAVALVLLGLFCLGGLGWIGLAMVEHFGGR